MVQSKLCGIAQSQSVSRKKHLQAGISRRSHIPFWNNVWSLDNPVAPTVGGIKIPAQHAASDGGKVGKNCKHNLIIPCLLQYKCCFECVTDKKTIALKAMLTLADGAIYFQDTFQGPSTGTCTWGVISSQKITMQCPPVH